MTLFCSTYLYDLIQELDNHTQYYINIQGLTDSEIPDAPYKDSIVRLMSLRQNLEGRSHSCSGWSLNKKIDEVYGPVFNLCGYSLINWGTNQTIVTHSALGFKGEVGVYDLGQELKKVKLFIETKKELAHRSMVFMRDVFTND